MPPRTDVSQILSRFPGPVTLYPSRRKWLLVFVGGVSFAIGGAFMVRSSEAMGWLPLIFFSLVALVAAVAMLPGAGALTLDRDGFEVTSLFRRHHTRWQDAHGFAAARIPPATQRWAVYDDISQSGKRLAKINVEIVGRNAALPDTYGLSPDDLGNLMMLWRERAVT